MYIHIDKEHNIETYNKFKTITFVRGQLTKSRSYSCCIVPKHSIIYKSIMTFL